jgi:hypothetical protein
MQSLHFAHYIDLTMDEGTYLVKGLLFTSGQYRPFQFYGPWTQKMPLSYYIPGFIESIFEPGLRTGRYLSIIFGFLILLGVWLILRRLCGNWWATLGVVILSLGTGNIISYTQAISQPIVAALIVWSLVLTLGADRSLWKIAIGSVLATSVLLVRQNMLPFTIFLLIYVFWQHGKQPGFISLGIIGGLLITVHLLYWPNILSIYTFLPEKITPFLDTWRSAYSNAGISQLYENGTSLNSLFDILNSYRYNFLAILGGLFGIIYFPTREYLQDDSRFKTIAFLMVSFWTLLILHLIFSLGVESFRVKNFLFRYMSFFSPIGVILFILSSKSLQVFNSLLKNSLAVVVAILSIPAIFLGAYQVISGPIMNIRIPRTRNMRILPGSTDLWRALANKFHLSYETQQMLLPAILGFFVAILIIFLCILFTRQNQKFVASSRFGYSIFVALILFGIVLAPTQLLNSNVISDQCEFDVIQANERVGNYLNQIIPSGSLVYWDSNNSPVPLLYLDDVKIFPPQLDQIWNFNIGGDPDLTYKYGFWNQELADQWMREADYLLITDLMVGKYTSDPGFNLQYKELPPLEQTIGCRDKSIIHIYKKIQ